MISDAAFNSRFNHIFHTVNSWVNVKDKSNILDFGCGAGIAALNFALKNPGCTIYGCDISDSFESLGAIAEDKIKAPLPANLYFKQMNDGVIPFDNKFDLIFSWSVFEHVNVYLMDSVISDIKSKLNDNGLLFIQIDPLYYSARGSHLYHILKEPWIHLKMQHDNLREAVFKNQENSKTAYFWDEYEKLNKLTVNELICAFRRLGFKILKQEITRDTEHVPTEELLGTYNEDVLLTNSVILLMEVIDKGY